MALDLRQLRESATDTPDVPPELVAREHQFTCSYTAPDGQEHTDELVSRILDGDERILVARLAARRAACIWEHLPATHAARIWAIATVAVQLREPPDWVGKWAVEDDSLLFSIFDVLQTHESFFFRGDRAPGQTEENPSRVAISSSLTTRPTPKPA
jgi:hypothetical protein